MKCLIIVAALSLIGLTNALTYQLIPGADYEGDIYVPLAITPTRIVRRRAADPRHNHHGHHGGVATLQTGSSAHANAQTGATGGGSPQGFGGGPATYGRNTGLAVAPGKNHLGGGGGSGGSVANAGATAVASGGGKFGNSDSTANAQTQTFTGNGFTGSASSASASSSSQNNGGLGGGHRGGGKGGPGRYGSGSTGAVAQASAQSANKS